MAAGKLDIYVEHGTTFNYPLTYSNPDGTPIDLTSFTARMKVKKYWDDVEIIADLTTENSRIEIDALTGTITLKLTEAETRSIPVPISKKRGFDGTANYLYDLELIDIDGNVTRLVEGYFTVKAEITD